MFLLEIFSGKIIYIYLFFFYLIIILVILSKTNIHIQTAQFTLLLQLLRIENKINYSFNFFLNRFYLQYKKIEEVIR